ncbi:MAG: hypothetical protein KDA37_08885 [Planctomycetales bacterium]|nr:hypothetical protein [Planctomycetales bacterium]
MREQLLEEAVIDAMTENENAVRSPFWKQQLPTIWMVASFLVFMNASSAWTAAIGGSAALAGVAWMIVQRRRAVKPLGRPVFRLGHMAATGPTRMRGWYGLGAFAFALLGVLMFLRMVEMDLPERIGMSLITFSIAGAFLVLANADLRTVGLLLFGVGFVVAGGMFLWAAVGSLRSGDDHATLEATKWTVFALFVLIGGLPTTAALLSGRVGATPIYDAGVAGPYGFVSWEAAEKVELLDRDDGGMLVVGAYNGWELRITVPKSSREAVRAFLSKKANIAAAKLENANPEVDAR